MLRNRIVITSITMTMLVSFLGACSSDESASDPVAATSAESTVDPRATQGKVTDTGLSVSADVDGTTVSVIGDNDVARTGTPLVMTPAPTVQNTAGAALTSAKGGISVVLGDNEQPQSPLTLEFTLPSSDTTYDSMTSNADPVVVAISASNPDVSQLLPAIWDSTTRTLTATTTHLSTFYPAKVDVSDLREKISDNVDGFLGRTTDAPSCYGKAVTIGETTYETTAPKEEVVWPCLSDRGGNLVLSLYSNSPLGWIVRSTPPPLERRELTDLTSTSVATTAVYGSLLASDVRDGTMLLPLGSSELTFNPKDVPRKVDMRVQAAMTLVDIGMHGSSMLWGGNPWLDATNPATADAFIGCATTDFSTFKSASDKQAGDMSRKLFECGSAAMGGNIQSEALGLSDRAKKLMGNKISGLSSLPKSASLLSSTITGLGGEFNGKNSASVVIRARGGDSVDLAGVPDEVFDIERIEMDNKMTEPVGVGRKVGPYRYKLSDRNQVDVTYKWRALTADNNEYNEDHCQVVVSVEGPQFFDDLKSALCSGGYSSSFGGITKLTVNTPGDYIIRVSDAITGLTAQTKFTVER